MQDEDIDKSLEYILYDMPYGHYPCNSYFLKCNNGDNIFYGRLDVEQGLSENIDDHCEQCFNEQISWFRFRGDNKKCYVYLIGSCGLKKFNHFKERNELNKILGPNVEIIDVII